MLCSFVLFGEWLWCQHAVSYDKLPDFFIAFDILEKKSQKYVSHQTFVKMVNGLVQTVPLVKQYTVSHHPLPPPFGSSLTSRPLTYLGLSHGLY